MTISQRKIWQDEEDQEIRQFAQALRPRRLRRAVAKCSTRPFAGSNGCGEAVRSLAAPPGSAVARRAGTCPGAARFLAAALFRPLQLVSLWPAVPAFIGRLCRYQSQIGRASCRERV